MQSQEEFLVSERSNTESMEESLNTSDCDPGEDQVSYFNPPSEHSVVIFDWDNTLFCTQYFEMLQLDFKAIFAEQMSLEDVGAYLLYELQVLEEKLINLFADLLDKGAKVFIVTNADEKWIKNCLNHFLPELNEFIVDNEVKVYSAKKMFGKSCPIEKWKVNY